MGRQEEEMVPDRRAWLDERRQAVEASYDAEAPEYDALDVPITPTHREFVNRLVETCPPGGVVLDVPCGTGKYFGLVREAGRSVVGVDQSTGMLAQAAAKGLASDLRRGGLQELEFEGEFDAVMSIDALENVPPEDWPLVLANLSRAVRPGGHVYLTVEEVDDAEIDLGLAAAGERGWPAVRGEILEGDTAGYHYYPRRAGVLRWVRDAGLEVVDEGYSQGDGYGYRHFLLRSRPPGPGARRQEEATKTSAGRSASS